MLKLQNCKSLMNYKLSFFPPKSDFGHTVKWNQNNYPFDEEPGEPSGDMV